MKDDSSVAVKKEEEKKEEPYDPFFGKCQTKVLSIYWI